MSLAPGQQNGNIRYVNARFINKGKTDVRIFPDRGVKKQIGYGVAKKSSTLLEFVLREGPLPYGMDFLVRKNDSDVILKLNDKEWIHVDAADDIQVVAEITITDGIVWFCFFYFLFVYILLNTDSCISVV